MLKGLREVYKDRRGTVPQRFVRHFKLPFKASTFYDARTIWNEVDKEVADVFEAAGRTGQGRWSLMADYWRQNTQNVALPTHVAPNTTS